MERHRFVRGVNGRPTPWNGLKCPPLLPPDNSTITPRFEATLFHPLSCRRYSSLPPFLQCLLVSSIRPFVRILPHLFFFFFFSTPCGNHLFSLYAYFICTIRDTPFSTPCRIIDLLRFESYLLTLATGQRAHAPRRTIRRDIGIDVSLPRIEGRILASKDRISCYKFLPRFPSPCSNCRFILQLHGCVIYSFIYRGYRKTRDEGCKIRFLQGGRSRIFLPS